MGGGGNLSGVLSQKTEQSPRDAKPSQARKVAHEQPRWERETPRGSGERQDRGCWAVWCVRPGKEASWGGDGGCGQRASEPTGSPENTMPRRWAAPGEAEAKELCADFSLGGTAPNPRENQLQG